MARPYPDRKDSELDRESKAGMWLVVLCVVVIVAASIITGLALK